MKPVIVLDSGPLGMVSNPNSSPENDAAKAWLRRQLAQGSIVVLPEIADYELRRELLRSKKTLGLRRLDALRDELHFLPIDSAVMQTAAELWALARLEGKPAATDAALDGDMILIAQSRAAARIYAPQNQSANAVIASTNARHLSLFSDAHHWQDIV